MTRQWLRQIALTVADSGGTGLDLSALRIVFTVRKTDAQAPNAARIGIVNLSERTASRIRREFSRVVLLAGYQDAMSLVFDGTITQVVQSRSGVTDTMVTLSAGDGDTAYNQAVVNTTLAAGAGWNDQVKSALGAMSDYGVGSGYVADLGSARLPRGKVLFGMARDVLRAGADSTKTSWSIQDGRVQMLAREAALPGNAVVLSSATGLIGGPERCQDGLVARCLLNPRLKVGGLVRLDGSDWRILAVEHRGDTHGSDWTTTLTCLET